MQRIVRVAGLLAALGMSGCLQPWGLKLPAIAFDSQGNPTQVMLPEKEVQKRMGASLSVVADSALTAFQESDRSHFAHREPLLLRTVAVGVGVQAEIGLGPYKIGATPHFRLMFTNSKEPPLP